MTTNEFKKLSKALFEGEIRASDVKTMPGVSEDCSREVLASALLSSMERMGLVKDQKLVDKNSQ